MRGAVEDRFGPNPQGAESCIIGYEKKLVGSWSDLLSVISIPDGALSFPISASDEHLLKGVITWVDLLAEGRFGDAFNLTAHDSHYAWTPDLIRSVIAGYGLPHEPGEHEYRISRVSEVKESSTPRWEVDRWRDAEPNGRVGFITLCLPLDGEWSDLTATFEILQNDGRLVLVLDDIHVL